MELRQLRHFQEIVRCASFGQAAEKLHITQPALSKSIRNLERSLGLTLLERHPSGVTPTEYGRVFLSYAALVTAELERAVEELNELKGRGRGVVRVGAGATMMRYVMPQAVRLFMEQQDGGSLTVRQGLATDLLAMLRRGDIDLMIGSIGAEPPSEDLKQEAVLEDTLVVVADRSHPLASKRNLSIEALAPFRWVLPDAAEAESERLARAMRRAGQATPTCAVKTSSSIFMATLLKDTAYLSYLPKALITLDPDYAHLLPIDLAEPIWPDVTVGVIYRRRSVMLPAARRFINRLSDVGRDLQARTVPSH